MELFAYHLILSWFLLIWSCSGRGAGLCYVYGRPGWPSHPVSVDFWSSGDLSHIGPDSYSVSTGDWTQRTANLNRCSAKTRAGGWNRSNYRGRRGTATLTRSQTVRVWHFTVACQWMGCLWRRTSRRLWELYINLNKIFLMYVMWCIVSFQLVTRYRLMFGQLHVIFEIWINYANCLYITNWSGSAIKHFFSVLILYAVLFTFKINIKNALLILYINIYIVSILVDILRY